MRIDDSRQKISRRLMKARLDSIDMSELLGLCKGVLADGAVNIREANFILQWLNDYQDIINTWPADVLYQTLGKVLEDGELSEDEEQTLIELLTEITGIPIMISIY